MTRKLTLLLGGALLLAGCREATTMPTRKDTLAELNVDQVLYGTLHVITRKGVRKANLHADTAYFKDVDSRVDLRGMRLEFFNEQTGAVSGTLSSRTGEYDMRTGAMIARGKAVLKVQGPEGERSVESEELHYDVQADRIWSGKPTVMREGGRTVHGASFESDTRFQNLTVQRAKVSGPAPSGGDGKVRF
ncbi:MAG: LPS export ABC transporter periplasmic protein LptC [Gemmatimonadota bacterium]|nr:LPS export ABC transporter periplasmic protein LptC [Gemmatimonadota bacterium]